jgi:AhpD family alkylhydroperoxidase
MTERMNPYLAQPQLTQPLIDFAMTAAKQSGIESSLQELVKIRASQLNHCAICLHMHARDARKAGESEMRIVMLDAWRESPLYNARERAALAWTEALTRLTPHGVADEDYAMVEAEFSEAERVSLTLMIGAINAFNRIGAGFRLSHPGSAPARAAA